MGLNGKGSSNLFVRYVYASVDLLVIPHHLTFFLKIIKNNLKQGQKSELYTETYSSGHSYMCQLTVAVYINGFSLVSVLSFDRSIQ